MSLSQYILDAREQYRLEIRQRNTWLIRLRWYYMVLLAIVTVLAATLVNDNASRNRRIALIASSVGLGVNLLLWLLTRHRSKSIVYYQTIALFQLFLDVSLAAGIIYYQGGLASRATVLFAIPIVAAGLLFTKTVAYLTAVVSSVGYALALALYRHDNPGSYELHQITLPVIFYAVVYFVIAVIVSAHRTRTASEEREKSYTELLSLLRHQLYHPSSVIAAVVDMLEHTDQYVNWPAKDKEYLQQLKHENRRLHTMITNMLESVSEREQEIGKAKLTDLVKLLNDESISAAMGSKRIKDLQVKLPNKAVEVEGDPDQLSTAFMNILANAFRYTDKGTPVIISLSEEPTRVTVSIHDKGKGMTDEEQRALFQLFTKMENRISGDPQTLYDTGLGLYVSKLIIERHHGKLELSSSAQYGTNVTVTLNRNLNLLN